MFSVPRFSLIIGLTFFALVSGIVGPGLPSTYSNPIQARAIVINVENTTTVSSTVVLNYTVYVHVTNSTTIMYTSALTTTEFRTQIISENVTDTIHGFWTIVAGTTETTTVTVLALSLDYVTLATLVIGLAAAILTYKRFEVPELWIAILVGSVTALFTIPNIADQTKLSLIAGVLLGVFVGAVLGYVSRFVAKRSRS